MGHHQPSPLAHIAAPPSLVKPGDFRPCEGAIVHAHVGDEERGIVCAGVLRKASEGVFVPLTIGGGIRDLVEPNGSFHTATACCRNPLV